MSDPQLRWCRLWTDIVDDAKLLLLSPADRWYYVALLALKRSGMLDEGDESAVTDRKICVRLRLDERERDELRRRLTEVRLIDDAWQPSGWDNRQFESDSSAERTRKWRRNKKRFKSVAAASLQRHGDGPESEQRQSQIQKQNNPPIPPAGVTGLDESVWKQFVEYRIQIRRPLKPASIPAAQQQLAAFGVDQAAVLAQTMAAGWQGLFPLKSPSTAPRPRLRTADEIEAEEKARAGSRAA